PCSVGPKQGEELSHLHIERNGLDRRYVIVAAAEFVNCNGWSRRGRRFAHARSLASQRACCFFQCVDEVADGSSRVLGELLVLTFGERVEVLSCTFVDLWCYEIEKTPQVLAVMVPGGLRSLDGQFHVAGLERFTARLQQFRQVTGQVTQITARVEVR